MDVQTEFNWEKTAVELDTVAKSDKVLNVIKKGIIGKITKTTAGEVYGDKAKSPRAVVIQVEVDIPELDRSFKEAFALPKDDLSWLNRKFKLRQFVDRYGKVPRLEMEVNCVPNVEGFFRILL